MELEFTFIFGSILVCLLLTFLILLKGTKNFVYRTTGLLCFLFLIIAMSYGYINLLGKPKPLNYELWEQKHQATNNKKESDSKGKESSEGSVTVLEMDVLAWVENQNKGEAYLWFKDKNKDSKPKSYSFNTTTKAGKELLKQLKKASQNAKLKGLSSRGKTGIILRIPLDTLRFGLGLENFKFTNPPAKVRQNKEIPIPGLVFPGNAPSPNIPGLGVPTPRRGPGGGYTSDPFPGER